MRTRHPYLRHSGPIVLAHRGFPGDGALENSMAAFARAQAEGAHYLETDVQVTADGDAVLFHDDTLLRLFGDPRPVTSVRTRELERLFADHGGLAVLEDALAAFPTLHFNIDVKTAAGPSPVAKAISRDTDRVLLTSFDAKMRNATLEHLKTHTIERPAISPAKYEIVRILGRAMSPGSPGLTAALGRFDAVQIPQRQGRIRVLSDTLLQAAKAAGTDVHIWTINSPHTMLQLVSAGVDGIVTDDAATAIRTLGRTP